MVTTTELIGTIVPTALESFSDKNFQGPVLNVDPSFPTRGGPGLG